MPRSEPQRNTCRLERPLHHSPQVGGQIIEVDVVAKPGTEAFQRVGRVILLAMEALINTQLNTPPQWLIGLGGRREATTAPITEPASVFNVNSGIPPWSVEGSLTVWPDCDCGKIVGRRPHHFDRPIDRRGAPDSD